MNRFTFVCYMLNTAITHFCLLSDFFRLLLNNVNVSMYKMQLLQKINIFKEKVNALI